MSKVAFVLADDFEDSEFKVPYDRIAEAGHEVTVIGTEAGREVRGKRGQDAFTPTTTPDQVSPADFDALVIPGGYSPDKLRTDGNLVTSRKPDDLEPFVAAILRRL